MKSEISKQVQDEEARLSLKSPTILNETTQLESKGVANNSDDANQSKFRFKNFNGPQVAYEVIIDKLSAQDNKRNNGD